ncbi:class A beta-lactamase [Pseudoblastomonas halimionae]|uniref:beta-lactamase n=1 Tax=Alteriqipengyuania halimionae TaxID=1926630 RepID=A0A6I4U466_9SPHN|nr:class A beta-lactamase [Alteriqipengyuania halimionae]MXP09703.1 class A beta-lactamase [Alteriqipengyuania halimionae]
MSLALRFIAILFPVLGLVALAVIVVPRLSAPAPDPVAEEAEALVEPELPTPEEATLDRQLSEIGSRFAGQVGIAVRPVEGDRTMQYRGLELFPQQSVSKLWVSLTALRQVDAGKLSLDEARVVTLEDLTLFHQPIRDEVLASGSVTTEYRDLMQRALTRSDNTANDIILRRVGGPDAVQATLNRLGLSSIRFGTDERTKQSATAGLQWRPSYSLGRAFYDARDQVPDADRRAAYEGYLADPIDGAAPVAIAAALTRLAKGELLSKDSTALLLDTLAETRSGPNRLKGGLPPDWRIAHKTGTGQALVHEQTGYNDIGILTAPDGRRYAVVVMIARTEERVPDRMAMMHEVVGAVAEYHDATAQ